MAVGVKAGTGGSVGIRVSVGVGVVARMSVWFKMSEFRRVTASIDANVNVIVNSLV